jgi:hypothetical protein
MTTVLARMAPGRSMTSASSSLIRDLASTTLARMQILDSRNSFGSHAVPEVITCPVATLQAA